MQTSRRDFFKVAAVGSVATTVFGLDPKPAYAQLKELKIARANETRSTSSLRRGGLRCPYLHDCPRIRIHSTMGAVMKMAVYRTAYGGLLRAAAITEAVSK